MSIESVDHVEEDLLEEIDGDNETEGGMAEQLVQEYMNKVISRVY